jgi:predicted amidohydrolase YtcJ
MPRHPERFWLAALGWLTLAATARAAPAPDLILRNGHIFTGDPATPWAEALAIRGDRILAVGGNDAVGRAAAPGARVMDLGGRMAIPGINDAHDHLGEAPFGTRATTRRPPMADPSLAELTEAIAEAARTAPKGGWIAAAAGRSAMNDVKGVRAAIEAAGGDHPVVVHAWWGHGVILNARGLSALRIDDRVIDMPGGHYERDAAGHLTGKLEEYAAWTAFRRLQGEASTPATVAYLRAYADRRLREGVTSVQVMAGGLAPARLAAVLKAADLPLRLRIVRFPIPDAHGDGLAEWKGIGPQLAARVRVSGIKWVLDGTDIDGLAWRTTSYPGRPDWRGRPNFTTAHLRNQLQATLAGSEPLLLHVVGDAMAEAVLTEMESLAPPERWAGVRVRIEHANGLTGPRLERARRLGVVVAQARPTAPYRAWVTAGLPVAYGSDMGFPPFAAFAGITAADNRNAVTREEAIAILTTNPAYAEFAETQKGVLAPGMLADVAVLSQDLISTPADKLSQTRSLLTLVGGKVAYDAGELN